MTVPENDALAKTNRINMLFDFYEPLLTEKQQTFLKYYFHDDYSLGEIAAEFDISRQAVYEHVKRAEAVLESYESKLNLLAKHQLAEQWLSKLDALAERVMQQDDLRSELRDIAQGLRDDAKIAT
ncbi:putative DNA-binding protein [Paenibacillus sp. R14(2021)]|uniref:putative DNA-binding protein n=1 Tax=Paenibacillus sp. R14(2021) TaxID=2859228 RepID=UPI001C61448F|nr:putative DNA-binding protein [Paenibacillus sp. R14(2021)]